MAYMGVDIGTTGTKAVVVLPDGTIVASAYRDYPLHQPRAGWAELDARQVWSLVCEIIRYAASQSPEPIRGIAFSALGEAVTPVGGNGEPLANTIIAMDVRAENECRWLGETLGARTLFDITGQPLHPMYSLNKILWWRNNKPDIFNRTWKFLCWQDYAVFLLGCEPAIDYSLASRTFTFDLREKCWNRRILDAAEISEEQLPRACPSGEIIGYISPRMADELGLDKNTRIVAGGFDQPSAALGAGILRPGIAVDGLGTVECITPALDHPVTDDNLFEGNIPCCPHVVPGLYIFMGFNFSAGSLLQWYRDLFAGEELSLAEKSGEDVYDLIVERALQAETGAMVLPHFLGTGTPHLDPHSRGAILGLRLGTSRHRIARAVLEGIGYEMRLNLRILEKAGVRIDELRATGGGAKSPAWLSLRADLFGKRITAMKTTEGGCLAMAMQAAVACGEYSNIEEAISSVIEFGKSFDPDPDRHEFYSRRFETYLKIYPHLKEINHELAEFEKTSERS